MRDGFVTQRYYREAVRGVVNSWNLKFLEINKCSSSASVLQRYNVLRTEAFRGRYSQIDNLIADIRRNGNDFIHTGTTLFTWEQLYFRSTIKIRDDSCPTPPSLILPGFLAGPRYSRARQQRNKRRAGEERWPAEERGPLALRAHRIYRLRADG